MPYIRKDLRESFLSSRNLQPANPGELNYCLTALCVEYLDRKVMCYEVLNEILGALEAAKMEFYRRVVTPYEWQKMVENGDVYK